MYAMTSTEVVGGCNGLIWQIFSRAVGGGSASGRNKAGWCVCVCVSVSVCLDLPAPASAQMTLLKLRRRAEEPPLASPLQQRIHARPGHPDQHHHFASPRHPRIPPPWSYPLAPSSSPARLIPMSGPSRSPREPSSRALTALVQSTNPATRPSRSDDQRTAKDKEEMTEDLIDLAKQTLSQR